MELLIHTLAHWQKHIIPSTKEVNHSELESDLPNIEPMKLNKLHQRLIAPSHFSTHFQFPGNQIFFKDFIVAAEHQTNFIEQLKIILTNELIDMNDSSYETLNLSTIDETEHENRHEYIVKSDTLSTLSVLAKFLGLILARPFIYEFGVNTVVDNRQIELRNKVNFISSNFFVFFFTNAKIELNSSICLFMFCIRINLCSIYLDTNNY